ncbi:MAG: HlyD family secretion protein, partial [Methylocystis sp.]
MTEQQEDAAAAPQGGSGGKKSRALTRKEIRTRRNVGLAIVALIAGLVALYFLLKWRTVDRHVVQTDNAFVTGNLIPVFADATGVVSRVLAEETQSVKQGELVVQLDAQRASAGLAQAEADLSRAVRSVGALFENRRRACERIL